MTGIKIEGVMKVIITITLLMISFLSYANIYVTSSEGDAVLSEEVCSLDKNQKVATIPSWKLFPKVAIVGCWKDDDKGNAIVHWYQQVGAGGGLLAIDHSEKIPLPVEHKKRPLDLISLKEDSNDVLRWNHVSPLFLPRDNCMAYQKSIIDPFKDAGLKFEWSAFATLKGSYNNLFVVAYEKDTVVGVLAFTEKYSDCLLLQNELNNMSKIIITHPDLK